MDRKIRTAKNETIDVTCSCCGAAFTTNAIVKEYTDGARSTQWIGTCPSCGGLIGGGLPEALAYQLVEGVFSPLPEDVESQNYFDIWYYNEVDGRTHRRHGWYDLRDSKLTQVG